MQFLELYNHGKTAYHVEKKGITVSQKKTSRSFIFGILMLGVTAFIATDAHAVILDWKGYFRADNNYVRNYQMDSAATGTAPAAGGEHIRGEGSKSATYTTFFAKFKPSALINDNIIVHSEWNIGDPEFGFFGRGVLTVDRDIPTGSGRNSLGLDAARLWLDAHTD